MIKYTSFYNLLAYFVTSPNSSLFSNPLEVLSSAFLLLRGAPRMVCGARLLVPWATRLLPQLVLHW